MNKALCDENGSGGLLDGDTRKSLLVINQFLPSEQGSLWATTKELRDRLVVCGVRRELTLAHVAAALKTSNKELKFFKNRRYNKINYFVHNLFFDARNFPNK